MASSTASIRAIAWRRTPSTSAERVNDFDTSRVRI
jgi:hypothetical protein